jgi:hypothetical protein
MTRLVKTILERAFCNFWFSTISSKIKIKSKSKGHGYSHQFQFYVMAETTALWLKLVAVPPRRWMQEDSRGRLSHKEKTGRGLFARTRLVLTPDS